MPRPHSDLNAWEAAINAFEEARTGERKLADQYRRAKAELDRQFRLAHQDGHGAASRAISLGRGVTPGTCVYEAYYVKRYMLYMLSDGMTARSS